MNLRQMGEVNEGIVLYLMEMDITLQWEAQNHWRLYQHESTPDRIR